MKLILRKRSDKLIAGIVVVLVLLLFYQGVNINYKVEDGGIRIHWFGGVVIPLEDISEIKVLDTTPPMQKLIGVDLGNIKQGTYSIEGVGRVKIYARDIKRKLVLIKTQRMIYGLTPEDTEGFVRLITKEQYK